MSAPAEAQTPFVWPRLACYEGRTRQQWLSEDLGSLEVYVPQAEPAEPAELAELDEPVSWPDPDIRAIAQPAASTLPPLGLTVHGLQWTKATLRRRWRGRTRRCGGAQLETMPGMALSTQLQEAGAAQSAPANAPAPARQASASA